MAKPRKNEDCAETRVYLCAENLKAVKEKKASYKFEANGSFVINKIIEEWREMKNNTIEKK